VGYKCDKYTTLTKFEMAVSIDFYFHFPFDYSHFEHCQNNKSASESSKVENVWIKNG